MASSSKSGTAALILVEAGDVTGALRMVKRILDPYEQARVLAEIVEAQAAKYHASDPGGGGAGSATGIGGNRYLTQQEAAAFLRLSPRTLERMRLDSSGPRFVKAGRRVLYKASEIESWTESRTFQNTSQVMD